MENPKSQKEKIQRIKIIIEREIEKELANKQNEVTDISEKIKNVLRNLDLLKYIVAVNYYDQNTTLTQKKGQDDENEEEKAQSQIHPCIKKLFPFKSNYNNSFVDPFSSHSYDTRKSKKSLDEIKNEGNSSQEKCDGTSSKLKIPQYIPPLPSTDETITTVGSGRGEISKEKYRVIVGNISKWIPPDTREDNSTHKWMAYVRSKDPDKDIKKLLRKVRFFLHESYKPHDIIDVTSPPFQLTRRGWGEFPIRVQLHFTHPSNKPIDIIHNLKLDMTCSGVQMLGGETAVDICLYQDNSGSVERSVSKSEANQTCDLTKEETVREKQDVFDGSLLNSINGIKPMDCIMNIKKEIEIDDVIKEEPEDYSEYEKPMNSKMNEMNLAINSSRKFLLDRRKIIKVIEIEHNYLKSEENDVDKPFNNFTNSYLKLEVNKNLEKTIKNGALLGPEQVNFLSNKNIKDQFNKVGAWSNKSEEEIFKSLKAVARKMETEAQSKYSMRAFRQMYLANVIQRAQATKLSLESLIRWFVQRWPIVTNLSMDPMYKIVHPYSSPSEEEFFKYNIGKQRSAEWFRAKAIQKVLQKLKVIMSIKEEIWTTKQILLWSRFHGYSPLSFQKVKTDSTETNELRNKRLKSNESSSDSDEGTSDNPIKKFKRCDDRFLNGFNATERKKNYKRSRRKEYLEEVIERNKNYKEINTCTEASDGERFGANEFRVLQPSGSDSDIEVVEILEETVKGSPSKKREATFVVTTSPSEDLFNKFVSNTVREIGIKVVDEEIIPGVQSDSVSRVLSQCASNFLEELLRRSFAHAWLRNGERCPDSLEVNDILATLIDYQHFDVFTNRGLGIPYPEKS